MRKSMLGAGIEPALRFTERDFKSNNAPIEPGSNGRLYGNALHDDAPKRTAPATTLVTTGYALSSHPIFPALQAAVLMAGLNREGKVWP